LDACRSERWPLRESTDQLVQKLFCADLEMERVAAVLDTDVQELEYSQSERTLRSPWNDHTLSASRETLGFR